MTKNTIAQDYILRNNIIDLTNMILVAKIKTDYKIIEKHQPTIRIWICNYINMVYPETSIVFSKHVKGNLYRLPFCFNGI